MNTIIHHVYKIHQFLGEEEFEDTKVVIIIRKSKDRQHNGQKKKDKRTNNDIQNKKLISKDLHVTFFQIIN